MMVRKSIEQSSHNGRKHEDLFDLMFNTKLKEFAHQLSVLSNLETAGEISSVEAFEEIEILWQQLEQITKELAIAPW